VSRRDDASREVSAGANEVRYHSSREERTAGQSPKKPRGGFLKHNRSLAIILIDVVFVFIVFLLFRFFTTSDPNTASLAGVDFTLEAFEFDNEVYLTVTARTDEERSSIGQAPQVFTAAFPDGSEVSDVLPTEPDYPVEIRAVLPRETIPESGEQRSVRVSVEVADEQLELVASIGR
jgi:hypothetical protein